MTTRDQDGRRPDGPVANSAHAPVGSISNPNRSEAEPERNGFGRSPAHAPVGSKPVILNGNTDTRGIVTGEERERLAQTFGKILRDARTSCGLSLPQLGRLAGVGERHLRYLEAGERRPSVDAIKALARVIVPSAQRERLEAILADAAGESLREGAQRKKRRAEHTDRKAAARDLLATRRKAQALIAQYERAGHPVPDMLRLIVDSPAVSSALESTRAHREEPTIKGSAAADRLERRRDPKGYMRRKIAEIKRTTK